MTDPDDLTCCDYACYEDDGCGCEGCKELSLGWYGPWNDERRKQNRRAAQRLRLGRSVTLFAAILWVGLVPQRWLFGTPDADLSFWWHATATIFMLGALLRGHV